jgi:hypothetical protein
MRRCTLRCLSCALVAPLAVADAQSVRDSAGVEIVENRIVGLSPARAWRIDRDPMIRMGSPGADADTLNELQLVMGITRLTDGRFAVGVQASNSVRFFEGSGKLVGSVGRRGQGPGEFRQIMGVWATSGDTLVVLDLGELEIFTGDGKLVAQGASRSRGDRFIYPATVLRDGSYLGVQYDEQSIPPAGRARRTRPVVRVSRDGTRIDTVGSSLSNEEIFDGRNWFGSQWVVFSRPSLVAGDETRHFISSPVAPEIKQVNRDGRAIRVIRLPDRSRKPGNEEIRAYRSWALAMTGEDGRPMSPAMKARTAEQLEKAIYADRMPSFGNLIVDRAGYLWVQRFDFRSVFFTPGPARTQTMTVASKWDVLDQSGRWITTVDLPARFTPVEIGVDYIAGLARDEDEIEQVHVYRLRKPQSPE